MPLNKSIILASGSAARQTMLHGAGLDFSVIPANIDEAALLGESSAQNTADITLTLALAKARHIAAQRPAALVIGADQTLEFEGKILSKSPDIGAGKDVLRTLAGKTHRLYSAVCVVCEDRALFTHTDHADLTMHAFDEEFLEDYTERDPDALTSCVGGYKIEGTGAWLFERVEGDYFTIMGLPLLPLLAFLRTACKITP